MNALRNSAALVLVSGCTLALLISCGQNESAGDAAKKAEPTSAFATFEGKQVHYMQSG